MVCVCVGGHLITIVEESVVCYKRGLPVNEMTHQQHGYSLQTTIINQQQKKSPFCYSLLILFSLVIFVG